MKRFIVLSLFLFSLIGTMLIADDAKVLPPNVFRVRMVPLIVNTDQYFRSNGEIGPYIWENFRDDFTADSNHRQKTKRPH